MHFHTPRAAWASYGPMAREPTRSSTNFSFKAPWARPAMPSLPGYRAARPAILYYPCIDLMEIPYVVLRSSLEAL